MLDCIVKGLHVHADGITTNARELIEEIRTGRAQYDFVEVGLGFFS